MNVILHVKQHKKNVKKQKKEQQRKATSPAPPATCHQSKTAGMPDDEAKMWARLEELERLEAEQGEATR